MSTYLSNLNSSHNSPYFSLKRKIYFFWLKQVKPFFSSTDCTRSNIPIDIVIPAVQKDLPTLPIVIEAIRKHVLHPIHDIIIIAPDDVDIQKICTESKCKFIDETTVLPIDKITIKYTVNGIERSGWIFQQLLKLGSDSICTQDYYLVVDADTVFIRDICFKRGIKTILNCSDEYHYPYFETFGRLLGYTSNYPMSFVSHCMLFEKNKLREIKKSIEAKEGKTWYLAIISNLDKQQASSFSEYETYGHYVFKKYKNSVLLEYWFNLALKSSELENLDSLSLKYSRRFKSVSFHTYL